MSMLCVAGFDGVLKDVSSRESQHMDKDVFICRDQGLVATFETAIKLRSIFEWKFKSR
jgi:hypothetical protein